MSSKKLFFLTHGVGGNSNGCFFPSLKSFLEGKSIKVIAPSYPNSPDPIFDEWKEVFLNKIKEEWKGEDIYLLGHSLGGYFTLRLLGECFDHEWTKHLKGVVLVAPTSTKRPERRRFYSEEIKWENILKLTFKLILLYSNNDEKVAPEHSQYVIEKLSSMDGFEFRQPVNRNHFISPDEPDVIDAVNSLIEAK
ncbi:leucine--tRNA ligase [Histomonas meleagridis]|uniref:leucine--tRNA ligase n=1 Tax=Histomonas meleagridis TaxID=135588 RepID=UPI00355A226F|nr:leucine--tRNA ligase [Histomonas meleagridis]KAH0806498.1 leucine--tRNA ligase [Histomonas meleagridis]